MLFSLDCCDRDAMRWPPTSGCVSGEMVRKLMRTPSSIALVPRCSSPLMRSSGSPTKGRASLLARPASLRVRWDFWSAPRRPIRPSPTVAEAFVKTFKRDSVYVNQFNLGGGGHRPVAGLVRRLQRVPPEREPLEKACT